MNRAKRFVRKRFPYALAVQDVNGNWEILVAKGSRYIVSGQQDEEAAWLAAADRLNKVPKEAVIQFLSD